MAHKKGAASTRAGRDSKSKRLGVKVFAGQTVRAGTILVRQKGSHIHAGNNVSTGKDFTLYALIDGNVQYEPASKNRRKASVYTGQK